MNKKLIGIALCSSLLLSGCTSVLRDINNALDPSSKKNDPAPLTLSIYPANTFFNKMTADKSKDSVFIDLWGKPQKSYVGSSYYILSWQPKSDDSCTVMISFDPIIKTAIPGQYQSRNCEKTILQGPQITYDLMAMSKDYTGALAFRAIGLNDIMNDWLGQDIDTALRKWGAPKSRVELRTGGQVYTWITYWEYTYNGWGDYYYGNCEQTLISNKNGKIDGWNYADCNQWASYGIMPKVVPIPKAKVD